LIRLGQKTYLKSEVTDKDVQVPEQVCTKNSPLVGIANSGIDHHCTAGAKYGCRLRCSTDSAGSHVDHGANRTLPFPPAMVDQVDEKQKEKSMMLMIETNTMRDISLSGALSMPLLDAGKARALLLSLDTGQAVAPCQMPFLVLYYFIEGQGQMRMGDKQAEFQTGSLVAVPAGAVRSISASQQTRVLAVQIP
jgi:quercetin dioxygenase-like cupin family protein